MWNTQTEKRAIDRLEVAGLVAPVEAGGFENKVLDQIAINLAVPNKLAFTGQIHTRVLLTDTIEATTVGNTILMSRGLIDSLPSEEAIASWWPWNWRTSPWAIASIDVSPSTKICYSRIRRPSRSST